MQFKLFKSPRVGQKSLLFYGKEEIYSWSNVGEQVEVKEVDQDELLKKWGHCLAKVQEKMVAAPENKAVQYSSRRKSPKLDKEES